MARKLSDNVDRDAPAFRIAVRWGDVASFSRALGRPFTTVRKWVENGEIPPGDQEAIIAASKRDKVKPPIRPEDFVDKRKFNVEPAAPLDAAA